MRALVVITQNGNAGFGLGFELIAARRGWKGEQRCRNNNNSEKTSLNLTRRDSSNQQNPKHFFFKFFLARKFPKPTDQ